MSLNYGIEQDSRMLFALIKKLVAKHTCRFKDYILDPKFLNSVISQVDIWTCEMSMNASDIHIN